MRTRLLVMVGALLLIAAGASAQSAADGFIPSDANRIDFGMRGTLFDDGSDEARYQRYRDLRDGVTVDTFRLTRLTDRFHIKVEGDHLGYRDQRLSGSYNNFGKLKASFDWNQTPLFYSQDTRSLYTATSPGVFVLDNTIQTGLQNRTLTLPAAVQDASLLDMRARRDVASFNLTYSATRELDLNLSVTNTGRNGTQPYAGTFGISNIIAAELPAPVDHRTTELGAKLEWANPRGFGRVGYDGSFFRNGETSLVWDNPLRVDDLATISSRGRIALSPSSNMNTFSAAGGVNFAGRSRATAFVSIGSMTQNEPLLPFTINSAIAAIPLPRDTADLRARVTTMNYSVTSRPMNGLWLNARYRQYDFDNRSEPFFVGQMVNWDTSVAAANEEAPMLGIKRHTLDAEASVTPFRFVAFRGGYTREQTDRTHRMVEETKEDVFRGSVDLTGVAWLSVRAVYEHSERAGSEVDWMELLAIGEQPTIRHFDIADRTRDRTSAVIQVTPFSMLSFNGSVGTGRDDYPDTNFGLRSNDNEIYSVGFDFVPRDGFSLGASYGWEKYNALQASRTANPLPARTVEYLNDPTQQFNDPRRDWTDDSTDEVDTFTASVELTKLIPKTELRVGYDYSRAESTYLYGLAANSVIAAPVQLTPVLNELWRGTVDVQHFLTKQIAVGMAYWYDRYDVQDFALGPRDSLASPATASASLMLLGYWYKPYTANTFSGRLTYYW
jgi:MtrB/PioB family decaheme-associated outer membrane protein